MKNKNTTLMNRYLVRASILGLLCLSFVGCARYYDRRLIKGDIEIVYTDHASINKAYRELAPPYKRILGDKVEGFCMPGKPEQGIPHVIWVQPWDFETLGHEMMHLTHPEWKHSLLKDSQLED